MKHTLSRSLREERDKESENICSTFSIFYHILTPLNKLAFLHTRTYILHNSIWKVHCSFPALVQDQIKYSFGYIIITGGGQEQKWWKYYFFLQGDICSPMWNLCLKAGGWNLQVIRISTENFTVELLVGGLSLEDTLESFEGEKRSFEINYCTLMPGDT